MKRLLILLTLLLAAGVGAWFFLASPPAHPSLNLTVFFSADNRGRLVPCGCFTGQYGGLTRLKTALDELDSRPDAPPSIRVDIGNTIGGREDFHLIEYRYILQAFAAMHYDAVNLGQREAQLSAAQLRELARQSAVPLLSANLLDVASRQPLLDPYLILRRGQRQIAVIGVTDPHGLEHSLGEGLAIEKMETALSRLLPPLKQKADLLVLLAFTDEQTLARLAREFYEPNLILGGKVSQPSQELIKENRSVILYTGNESRSFGRIRGAITTPGHFELLEHEIVLLHDRIAESETIRRLAQSYRDEVRQTRLALDDPQRLQEDFVPGVKFAATYAGSDACLDCHPAAAAVWQKSAHARAFASLQRNQADADPDCIACHTVGFGAPSGYQRSLAGAKLVNVGCESCHGPGSLHLRQYQDQEPITFKFRPLGAGDCQKCHHGEFSRPFHWDTLWPRIKHGQEPAQTALLNAPPSGPRPDHVAGSLRDPHPQSRSDRVTRTLLSAVPPKPVPSAALTPPLPANPSPALEP